MSADTKDAAAKKGAILRQTFTIGSDTYAADIYEGPVPPLSPGDAVVVNAKIPNDGTLYIVKKGTAPPPPPIPLQASDVSASTLTNTAVTIDLSKSITVPTGATVTSITASVPKNGAATVAGLSVVYTPNTGFVGTDTFNYSASDSLGATSNSATVTVSITDLPPPPPPTCPPGQHWDTASQSCVPDVVTPNVDPFGVKKMFGDDLSTTALHWFMDMINPGSDPRANNPESSSYMPKFIKNSDGSWKIKNQPEIRWAIIADFWDQSKLCTDFVKCAQQGYMMSPKDWKNIEMTAYYRINAVSGSTHNGEPHVEFVARGQRSTTSSTNVGICNCALGCSDNMHGNFYPLTGRQKDEKDYFHTTGYGQDITGVNTNNASRKWDDKTWIGLKYIVYNKSDGSVEMEHWTDPIADNNWVKTRTWNDHGQWPPRGAVGNCNLHGAPPISFGGPLSVLRSDNVTDYDVKNCSIRSVDPGKPLMGAEHASPRAMIFHKEPDGAVIDKATGEEMIITEQVEE